MKVEHSFQSLFITIPVFLLTLSYYNSNNNNNIGDECPKKDTVVEMLSLVFWGWISAQVRVCVCVCVRVSVLVVKKTNNKQT